MADIATVQKEIERVLDGLSARPENRANAAG
jgi:hypothetical protein